MNVVLEFYYHSSDFSGGDLLWDCFRRLHMSYLLTMFFFCNSQPSYIYDLLPPLKSFYWYINSFNLVTCKSEYFKNSFIPNVIYEWNKLDPDIRSSASYNLFRNTLLKFTRPVQRKTFNINGSVGVKLLTRLRLGFSHLREHKFRHGFRDILNPLCPCSIEAETTAHYFLRCYFYNGNRSTLMNELNSSFSTLNENNFIDLILYGSDKFEDKKNHNIFMCTIKFIKGSQRFDENLLYFFFLVLMWSEYVYYLYVYFRIIIFSFLLMIFSFSPTEILYISSRVLMYVFKFNFSFCVNNGLEKKIVVFDWRILLVNIWS